MTAPPLLAPLAAAAALMAANPTAILANTCLGIAKGGIIRSLPDDGIIESPGRVDRFGINMVAGFTLPFACAATCQAAMTADVEFLKRLVLYAQMVDAVCPPAEVWPIVDEMLAARSN